MVLDREKFREGPVDLIEGLVGEVKALAISMRSTVTLSDVTPALSEKSALEKQKQVARYLPHFVEGLRAFRDKDESGVPSLTIGLLPSGSVALTHVAREGGTDEKKIGIEVPQQDFSKEGFHLGLTKFVIAVGEDKERYDAEKAKRERPYKGTEYVA